MIATDTRQTGADLLRGAAHLLRTPLGVIVGMSTTLRDYDERFSAEQRRRYLGEISNAAEEMRVAIDGMSLLARLVSGSLAFAPTPATVERAAGQAAEALAGVWGADAVRIVRAGAGTALVDVQRFGQAFESLARAARPSETTTLTAEDGARARFRLGPLQFSDDEAIATLTRPINGTDLSDWVARPGGWALLAARLLFEGQGAALAVEGSATAATITISHRTGA